MTAFIGPGATLGVIGGGQLGFMFVQAAQRLGYRTVVLEPDPASPAGGIAHRHIAVGYLDPAGLDELAACADAVTTEFENVPAAALRQLADRGIVVAPGASAVAVCQDRAAEKAAIRRCGVACAPHASIERPEDLEGLDDALFPAILKTATLGYDGKGQTGVKARAELAGAWSELGRVRCVLEKRLRLADELSVIVARGAAGGSVVLPVQQNLHRDGILAVTRVPARGLPAGVAEAAVDAAQRIAAGLGYVGVLCVEFFVLEDGSLVANEMAPRPHNSGHYSIDACDLSQFDLQVRTLTYAPLVAPRLHSPAVMLNLLGDLWSSAHSGASARDSVAAAPVAAARVAAARVAAARVADAPATGAPIAGAPGAGTPVAGTPPWADVLALPGAHLHLYGKAHARPGRKMGHLTLTAASPAEAEDRARAAASCLGIEAW